MPFHQKESIRRGSQGGHSGQAVYRLTDGRCGLTSYLISHSLSEKSTQTLFDMSVASGALCEASLAFVALIWPLAGVDPDMLRQSSTLPESFTAIATFEWHLSSMNPSMIRQSSFPLERLTAIAANEWSLASMRPNMRRVIALVVS